MVIVTVSIDIIFLTLFSLKDIKYGLDGFEESLNFNHFRASEGFTLSGVKTL